MRLIKVLYKPFYSPFRQMNQLKCERSTHRSHTHRIQRNNLLVTCRVVFPPRLSPSRLTKTKRLTNV